MLFWCFEMVSKDHLVIYIAGWVPVQSVTEFKR